MSYAFAYRGQFENAESDIDNQGNEKLVEIRIYDTESGESDDTAYTDLEMADDPLRLITVDNAEDKFNIFCGLRAEIRIHSSDQISIDTFAEGGDNRWYVEVYYDAAVKFKGWLSISDLSQDFQPDPTVITLIATDGLGFLEAEALTDFNGDNPQGMHPILSYICWALAKTGLQLDIHIVFNIRERYATPLVSDDSGDGHFFVYNYLNALTFESEIGVSENARTVIEKILKREARIGQRNGVWQILRIDEMQYGDSLYVFQFDYEGTYIDKETIDPIKRVGESELSGWMNDDCLKSLERPVKYVRLNANYDYPLELICNIDYQRGEESADQWLTDYTLYDLDCWTLSRNWGANETTPNTTAHIARRFNEFSLEDERFIIIRKPVSATNPQTYIKSSAVPISQNDRFEFSFQHAAQQDNNDGDAFILGIGIVVLYGDDGNVYTLDDGYVSGAPSYDPLWNVSNPELTLFRTEIDWNLDPSVQDLTQWVSYSVTAPPVPVDGELRFYLYAANRVASDADDFDIKYSSIQLTMYPFINGSFRPLQGQYYKVLQPVNPETFKAFIEDDVFISDFPKKAMKGCLQKVDGPGFSLPDGYYSAAVFPDGVPSEDVVHPYGWLQIYDVYNQFHRTMRKFEGSIDRLDEASDIPDMFHKYLLTDSDLSTNNKLFLALHMEQDTDLCETRIFLHECHDVLLEKQYPENEFEYITEENE